jgi:LysR family carnitine catabolism transcriptional activator
MTPDVSLNHLLALAEVAEHRSFRAAAAALHLSQPAVTARIKALEERLGIPLFHRTTRSVQPTAEGERLLATAIRLIGDLRAALEEMRQEATLSRGRVTVVAPPSVAAMLLPRAMAEFRGDYPGIEVVPLDMPSDRAIGLLAQGGADLGILSDLPPDAGLSFEPVFEDEIVAVLPRAHPLTKRRMVSLAALSLVPLLVPPRGPTLRTAIEDAFASAGLGWRPAQEALSPPTLIGLVEAGFGATFLPMLYAPRFDLSGCRLLRIEGRQLVRRMGIARRADRAEAPAGAALRAFLHRRLSDLLRESPWRTRRGG